MNPEYPLKLMKLTCLLFGVFAVVGQTTATAADQPNVIYINTDDWGIGKVPPYKLDDASMKIIKTPNLCLLYTSPSPRD